MVRVRPSGRNEREQCLQFGLIRTACGPLQKTTAEPTQSTTTCCSLADAQLTGWLSPLDWHRW